MKNKSGKKAAAGDENKINELCDLDFDVPHLLPLDLDFSDIDLDFDMPRITPLELDLIKSLREKGIAQTIKELL